MGLLILSITSNIFRANSSSSIVSNIIITLLNRTPLPLFIFILIFTPILIITTTNKSKGKSKWAVLLTNTQLITKKKRITYIKAIIL